MTAFHALALPPQLLKAAEKLGFMEATDVQAKTLPAAMAGKDVMVSAKTGSGKTAAFIWPMLSAFLKDPKPNSGTRGLILLPTRELALQTQKTFEKLACFTSIKAGLVIGGEAFKYQIAAIRRNPEVIIATPGRLVEHIEKGSVDFTELEVLVLDEADRMLDMGFAEDMDTIAKVCASERQNLLFSATLRHRGFSRIQQFMKDPERIRVDSMSVGHSQIVQQIVLADDDRHKENIVAALVTEESAEKVFVFCNTRAQSQKVSNILRSKKMKVAYIHGEVSQSDRKQVMNRFRAGQLQVLVATDVAARGLDIDDVELVVNYNVAHSGDDHVHRIGRTGRAGKEGKAVTLVDATEWNQMSSIERYLKIRFQVRKIEGLKAKYTGPKKLKNSGKAAGPKKKKNDKSKVAAQKPRKKAPARSAATKIGDGSGVLRRKKPQS